MKTKLAFLAVLTMMVFGVVSVSVRNADAQTALFPSGCSSGFGYSATTFTPCNGTVNSPLISPLPGCTTPLGFSSTTNLPCSGTSVAISFLAGCSSTSGYSVISARPCNGTLVATGVGSTPVVPGLPTTGDGGNALENVLILIASGLLALIGTALFAKESNLS